MIDAASSFVLNRRAALSLTTALVGAMAVPRVARAVAPSTSARVETLIAQMTVEEKVGQLTLYPDDVRPTPRPINPDINAQAEARNRAAFQFAEIKSGRVGALLGGTGVALGRQLQDAALQSRLRIPLMFGADVLHGLRTIFPIPLGLAASFEPELAEQTARAAAEEMTAAGVHWTYAPMVDVARDQRWGRVAEGSGEDPWLAAQFAAAYVRGFQGKALTSPRSVAACPKHFAGYGAVSGGKEYNNTDVTERELRQTHLPSFQAAFDAGALTTMAAFNDIDGVPASGSRHLLTDVLRGDMGFRGFVVSDAGSAEELVQHGVAANEREAAALSFNAGLDMNMGGGLFKRELPPLISSGAVTTARLDEAVRRILLVKEALGLFDDPYRSLDPARERTGIRTPAALAVTRRAAQRSVVLLKNEGGVLPLRDGAKVALVGPLGDDPAQLDGAWAPWAKVGEGVTLAQGLREAIGTDRLMVVKGADVDAPIPGGLDAAIAAARTADVVIAAIGEAQSMSGEARSRTSIIVPSSQVALIEALRTTGKPVIAVLSTGRALALAPAIQAVDAILVGWFLGSEGGRALADLLTGVVGPSGRLPVSFPRTTGQQPLFYNHMSTGRPPVAGEPLFFKSTYIDVPDGPAYPFGHGLTYSTIAYDAPRASAAQMAWDGSIKLSAMVRNTGRRNAEEVVQLYLHDVTASVTRPVRELKDVRKIRLAPGEAKQVTFEVSRDMLTFVGSDLKWRAEPGAFLAWIAPSSAVGEPVRFTLNAAS